MLFIVIAAFFICWGIGTRWSIPAAVSRTANRYVVVVALPALVFSKLVEAQLSSSMFVPIVGAWLVMGACGVAIVVVGRLLRWDRRVVGALLLVGVLGNTGFLGIGMVRALLGDESASFAIAYDQLGTFIALATYGAWVAQTYGNSLRGSRSIARQLVTFPPFIALVSAFVCRQFEIPSIAIDGLGVVGVTVAPVAMGALGFRFRLGVDRAVLSTAAVALAVKMVAVPLVCVACVVVWGGSGDVAWAATAVQSAAPPMVTAGVVAVDAGLDESLVTFVVGTGTLFSFAWLPLIALLV